MVKLSDSKGKSGEGFTRMFGNEDMGLLLSKVQAALIRSGIELEATIWAAIPEELHTTLDSLNDVSLNIQNRLPIEVVFKPSRPNPDNPKKSIQADFLVVDNTARKFMLVEVKEGHVFDTKKADGELASLKNITAWLAQEFAYRADYYLCSFNQETKEAIVAGTKKRFSIEHVLTGRELCEKIGIDYDQIREKRKSDQAANRRYFLSELLEIPEIHAEIVEILNISSGTGE